MKYPTDVCRFRKECVKYKLDSALSNHNSTEIHKIIAHYFCKICDSMHVKVTFDINFL